MGNGNQKIYDYIDQIFDQFPLCTIEEVRAMSSQLDFNDGRLTAVTGLAMPATSTTACVRGLLHPQDLCCYFDCQIFEGRRKDETSVDCDDGTYHPHYVQVARETRQIPCQLVDGVTQHEFSVVLPYKARYYYRLSFQEEMVSSQCTAVQDYILKRHSLPTPHPGSVRTATVNNRITEKKVRIGQQITVLGLLTKKLDGRIVLEPFNFDSMSSAKMKDCRWSKALQQAWNLMLRDRPNGLLVVSDTPKLFGNKVVQALPPDMLSSVIVPPIPDMLIPTPMVQTPPPGGAILQPIMTPQPFLPLTMPMGLQPQRQLQVMVPTGSLPGTTLQLTTPDGSVLQFTVPPNYNPNIPLFVTY